MRSAAYAGRIIASGAASSGKRVICTRTAGFSRQAVRDLSGAGADVPDQLSNEFKETVRTRTDLVALVSESITLASIAGGREFRGLCPFHEDHDPSLRVYPDRQTYRCWACNSGGDCFTWVMEQERVEFREALEILARRANIEIPRRGRNAGDAPAGDAKTSLYDALQWALGEFHQTLLEAPFAENARNYLRGRGFTDATIGKFKLGFSPASWDWLIGRARGKFSPQVLASSRLVTQKQNGGFADFFRGRVLFPIFNERGQPVSFGGRELPGDDASGGKYWNGSESAVYHKSSVLFGLNFARDAIKKANAVIVTEGYTDCIALHQAGIENVVATCGTALTDDHVKTIKRFARNVVLVYDGDKAGREAADKALARFLAQDVDLRILTLPHNQDPPEFLAEHSIEKFRELAAAAPEVWEYKFAVARDRHKLDTVDQRLRVLDEMLTLMAAAPDMSHHVREGALLGNLSMRLRFTESQVRERLQELRSKGTASKRPVAAERTPADPAIDRLMCGQLSGDDKLECELLEILFAAPETAAFVKSDIVPQDLRQPRLRDLLGICYELTTDGNGPTLHRVLDATENQELKRLAVWIDDQARMKNVRALLDEGTAGTDGCPRFLRRSIEQFAWRREEQSQERIAVELSAEGDGTHRIDEAAEAKLRQLTQFHQRRATSKGTRN
ncbi:MAG: DNA primase [Planctomycetaceae bacterium]|nr:DNA primase [Planctomycetaceae bacterium]